MTPAGAFRSHTGKKKLVAPLALTLISLLFVVGTLVPAATHASVLSAILSFIKLQSAQADVVPPSGNVQTLAIAEPAMNLDPSGGKGGGDITIVDDSALVPDEGPSGTIADIEKPANGTISMYIVQPGDTVASVADMFGVTSGTILSANDLKKGAALRAGESLVILPTTGVRYTVQKGDTLAGIAKRYGGNADEIVAYNGLDSTTLTAGTALIIPNGEVPASATVRTTHVGSASSVARAGSGTSVFAHNPREPAHNVGAPGSASEIAYYIAPLSGYTRTQGIHGYNAVDLAAPKGTPIMASAGGTVVVAKAGGWNGGYGSYVVISHGNGSQTLYSHMSKVAAYDGESVVQGQVIGYVGATGEATGPHVHFEIRNGIQNPF